mmetsp:Transcript_109081/g.213711  ORF Transcript_109081/g.213711 Transcript_109081/m.213711 type:complete len:421 (+) Transcript_109081:67-1329(+)
MSILSALQHNVSGKRSIWQNLPLAPPDKILGFTELFKADTNPKKVNLIVGAYRDDAGQPCVLNAIKQAEQTIIGKDKEYAAITGIAEFIKVSLDFAYGDDSEPLVSKRVAAAQCISGTGGCRLAAEMVRNAFGKVKVYIPDPTWANHVSLFRAAGLEPVYYKYYDATTRGVDFDGLVRDIRNAEDGSMFMMHACAHNPTGCDPTRAQWDELSKVMLEKQHLVFFDCAYQGFASGDAEADAYAIRKFVSDGHSIMLAQSFAKNFGLYGERVGCFSMITADSEEAERVTSQLKLVIRALYSNPPIHGARIVAKVLSDPVLKPMWYAECKGMADRILAMRLSFREKLEAGMAARGIPANQQPSWKHVTDQIGMFCYTGLTLEQVLKLRSEHHVYCTDDGRFSMAGLNTGNIDYVTESVLAVTV